jgi:Fe-S-cluster containining protein
MPDNEMTQEAILRDCARLGPDDRFTFECGRQRDCFTRCCAGVAIVLAPYDVLRLKRALGIDSSEFLDRYTIAPFTKDQKVPTVLLKMDAQTGACPFVSPAGCGVYGDRPWACRMYPLGAAEPRNATATDHAFHFLVREDLCHGHGEGPGCTVREWIASQGVEEYDAGNSSFKALMLDEAWDKDEPLTPPQMDMYYMACYDLDRFRRFVFETRLLEMFDVDEARVEAMRTDDEELLEFGVQWLRFSLFRQRTMKITPAARVAAERRAAARSVQEAR